MLVNLSFACAVSKCLQASLYLYKLLAPQLERELQLEKMNQNLGPELVVCTLKWSFSHANHQFGYDSLSPIAVDSSSHFNVK